MTRIPLLNVPLKIWFDWFYIRRGSSVGPWSVVIEQLSWLGCNCEYGIENDTRDDG